MSIKFFGILTHQGAARLANAAALGTKLELSTMAVGDGGGSLPFPEPTQTALKGERRRAALNQLSIDPLNGNQIIAEQVIPESEGGWWIREIGLFDKDGTLIAVANCPESYKPQMQEGSGRTQTIRMILIVNSTEELALKIDPSIVLATRKYVDDGIIEVKAYADTLMATHIAHADPHPQYAPKASPVFTGTPKAPTVKASDNSTQLATTAFVQAIAKALSGQPPSTLNTLEKLATALSGKLDKSENGEDIPDTAQFLRNLGVSEAVVPIGVTLPWPTEIPPVGWIKCDGKEFSKETFPQLAVIYPSGRTPDLRGEFIRGWDGERGADPGRGVLTHQEGTVIPGFDDDDTGDISSLGTPKVAHGDALTDVQRASIDAQQWILRGRTADRYKWPAYVSSRPRNIAFNYIVRAA